MITRRGLLAGAAGIAAGVASGAGLATGLATGTARAAAREAGVGTSLAGRTSSSPRPHWTTIGRTHQGRRIRAFRLGDPDAPSRYLVIGSMHGDEPAGRRVAAQLRQLTAPRGVQLWVVPTMNPDGLAAGTRTNARGVDLNRNFPSADWRRQGRGTSQWSGPRPASERETRAAVRFLRDLVPHTVISVHQPLTCVDFSGGDPAVTRWLAARLGLPARTLGASGGNLTTWFNDRYPKRTATTLELASSVSPRRARRIAQVLRQHAAQRR